MTVTVNAKLPAVQAGPIRAAQGYMVSATGLLPAVELLASSGSDHLRACAFLAAQVLECALKAFLSHRGMAEGHLRGSNRRHNLEALWHEAATHGLSIAKDPPYWCVVLNSAHDKPYHLRYQLLVHGITLPPPRDMVCDLQNTVAAVALALETP